MERKVKIDGERGGFIDAKAFALFVFFVVSFVELLGLVVLLVALAAATLLLDRFRLCCLLFVLLALLAASLISTSVFVLVEEVISFDLSVDKDRPLFLDFLLFLVAIFLGVLSMY